MRVEEKIKALLERASAGAVPQEPMKQLDKKDGEDVTSLGDAELSGKAAAAAATKTGLPTGNNNNGDTAPVPQGSSNIESPPCEEEDLAAADPRAPGKKASELAGKTGLPNSNSGGDASPPPQGSSNVVIPGQGGMTAEETKELAKVFTEAGLSEEVATKLTTMFENAVLARIEKEIDAAATGLAESVEKIAETNKNELYTSVNAFMNYVSEEWFTANELAVENGLRTEIAESFIEGMRVLFNEHNISVPETTVDAMVAQQDQIKELEAKLNESVASLVSLKEENRSMKRKEILESASKNLVKTDAEKLAKLVEDVDFDDADSFKEKVDTLKERYFPAKKPSTTNLSESDGDAATVARPEGRIGRYADAISRSVGNQSF